MMQADKRAYSDIVSSMGDKFEIENDAKNIPIIKYKRVLKGGWPEKYKILCSVALNHIIGKPQFFLSMFKPPYRKRYM